MSREVRRVALDYQHPVRLNPHWREQQRWRRSYGFNRHVYTGPRLLGDDERFVPLYPHEFFGSLVEEYERWYESVSTRSGHTWDFRVRYHLTGFALNPEDPERIHPFELDGENIWDEESVDVKDEDHLQELLLSEKNPDSKRPVFESDRYMPSFADVDEDQLGWCLYESVSEGTPVTPVFATAQQLADHLVEYGTLSDPPLSRDAADAVVSTGFTLGSFIVSDGVLSSSLAVADELTPQKPNSSAERPEEAEKTP